MPTVRITEPAAEPLSVADAMDYLRVFNAQDQSLVAGLIGSARDMVEMFTGRALISQQLRLTLAGWSDREHMRRYSVLPPIFSDPHISFNRCFDYIEIPRCPLISVDSVKYYDETNTLQTLDPASYVALYDYTPGRIQLVSGVNWPSLTSRLDAVKITFTAGYGTTAASVPKSLIQAIRYALKHYYDNRDAVVVERATVDELPMTLRNLIEMHRVDFTA